MTFTIPAGSPCKVWPVSDDPPPPQEHETELRLVFGGYKHRTSGYYQFLHGQWWIQIEARYVEHSQQCRCCHYLPEGDVLKCLYCGRHYGRLRPEDKPAILAVIEQHGYWTPSYQQETP